MAYKRIPRPAIKRGKRPTRSRKQGGVSKATSASLPPPGTASPVAASGDAANWRRVCLLQHLASRLTPCVRSVVKFAKRVPGFRDLSEEDKMILLKMGFFEMWLIHATRLATNSRLTFDDGAFFTRQQLESLYDVTFASSLLNFMSVLNSLGLNETELALFSAAVLFSSDRPGVTDKETVQHHQDMIFNALKYQISLNYNNGKEVADTLTMLFIQLRFIRARHYVLLDWFRVNWTSLNIPLTFAQMFDIPKYVDNLQ